LGIDQEKLLLVPVEKTDQLDLPEDYTIVPDVVLKKEKAPISELCYSPKEICMNC